MSDPTQSSRSRALSTLKNVPDFCLIWSPSAEHFEIWNKYSEARDRCAELVHRFPEDRFFILRSDGTYFQTTSVVQETPGLVTSNGTTKLEDLPND